MYHFTIKMEHNKCSFKDIYTKVSEIDGLSLKYGDIRRLVKYRVLHGGFTP